MTKAIIYITQYKTAFIIATMLIFGSFMILSASTVSATNVSTSSPANTQFGLKDYGGTNPNVAGIGLGDKSLDKAVVGLINVLLGFLGLIAVIIILIGGFRWMTAGGNDDKVGEARKTIFAGIIGLAIILFAWGITTFVVQQLGKASGVSGFETI